MIKKNLFYFMLNFFLSVHSSEIDFHQKWYNDYVSELSKAKQLLLASYAKCRIDTPKVKEIKSLMGSKNYKTFKDLIKNNYKFQKAFSEIILFINNNKSTIVSVNMEWQKRYNIIMKNLEATSQQKISDSLFNDFDSKTFDEDLKNFLNAFQTLNPIKQKNFIKFIENFLKFPGEYNSSIFIESIINENLENLFADFLKMAAKHGYGMRDLWKIIISQTLK